VSRILCLLPLPINLNLKSNLTLHEPADTSVEGSRTLAFLNRLAATSQATELIRVATAEGYDTEPDGVTTTAPETRLQIQGRMTLSAVHPPENITLAPFNRPC
jgi:hypothetical protein